MRTVLEIVQVVDELTDFLIRRPGSHLTQVHVAVKCLLLLSSATLFPLSTSQILEILSKDEYIKYLLSFENEYFTDAMFQPRFLIYACREK